MESKEEDAESDRIGNNKEGKIVESTFRDYKFAKEPAQRQQQLLPPKSTRLLLQAKLRQMSLSFVHPLQKSKFPSAIYSNAKMEVQRKLSSGSIGTSLGKLRSQQQQLQGAADASSQDGSQSVDTSIFSSMMSKPIGFKANIQILQLDGKSLKQKKDRTGL